MQLFKPTSIKRVLFFLISDTILSVFTIILAYFIRFKFQIPADFYSSVFITFLILIPLKIAILAIFRQYSITWKFYSFVDAKNLLKAHILIYIIFGVISFLWFKYFYIPKSIAIIDFFFSFVMLGGLRFFKRLLIENNQNDEKVIFIGANSRTQSLIKRCLEGELPFYPIAIFDDIKDETYISNVKVYKIEKLSKMDANSAIITKNLSPKELDKLTEKLTNLGIKDIKIATDFENKLKNLSIEDLLARDPKDLDKDAIKNFIKDKIVLITGAGGSIGSELSLQCVKFEAKKLILLDHSEFNLYQISQKLEDKNIVSVLQNITDKNSLEEIFKKHKIDIVLHAAAYKHVPLVEENIKEAIKNNIIGTKNCMDLAIEYKVQKFVMISTDKAVRPTNVMGATKRVCELYAQNLDSKQTEIVSVRFGNVLGSSGSVVPKFKEQIQNGGPITVTHPDITRYFMLIPEACQLVLQAASIGKGGELFILDMGEPVKIADLAKKMIELSGRNDIKIVYTGLRKGEKLYEELLTEDADSKTIYDSIMVAQKSIYDIKTLDQDIKKLLDGENKIDILKKIVPEFTHK